MLDGRKFNSRRVFILHGVLLASVMGATYLSVRAQYQNLADQALEEARIDQELITRGAAQSLHKHFQLVVATLIDLDRSAEGGGLLPPNALAHVAAVDRRTREVVSHRAGDDAVMGGLLRQAEWVSRLREPDVFVTTADTPPGVLVAVPMHGGNRVAVARLAPEHLVTEVSAAHARGAAGAVSALLRDDGLVLASTDAGFSGRWLQEMVPAEVQAPLHRFVSAGSAGSAIVDTGAEETGTTLMTIQPVDLPTGDRWNVVTVRVRQREAVGERLASVFQQLLLQGLLTVMALMVVVISTSISLWRGRRRMEQMRMELLDRDLRKARHIQLNWLPEPTYLTPRLSIAAMNQPALHISGDFYNWFELPANEDDHTRKTVLVIGDVSGHGLPAAFLMSTTQMIVKTAMPRVRDPGVCLGELNRQICSLVYNGQFVTMLILVIDHDGGSLEIASAGQAPPLVKRGENVEPIDVDPQLVIGVDDSIEYVSHRVRIEEGDTLLLYTDGIIETTNEAGEQFSLARLVDTLRNSSADPQAMINTVLEDLAGHRGEEEWHDDLTLVAAHLLPQQSLSRSPAPATPAAAAG